MFETIEKYLLLNMEKYKIPSLSIAIAKNQNIVFSKAYGYANIEEEIPATKDNVYRAASMTKQVIATALLKCLDDGMFRLRARTIAHQIKVTIPRRAK